MKTEMKSIPYSWNMFKAEIYQTFTWRAYLTKWEGKFQGKISCDKNCSK